MKTEKDLQQAREYIDTIADDDPSSNKFAFIKNGRITLSVEELAETLCNHVLHLEQRGVIKFTARREEGDSTPKCKHCGGNNCSSNRTCFHCDRLNWKL